MFVVGGIGGGGCPPSVTVKLAPIVHFRAGVFCEPGCHKTVRVKMAAKQSSVLEYIYVLRVAKSLLLQPSCGFRLEKCQGTAAISASLLRKRSKAHLLPASCTTLFNEYKDKIAATISSRMAIELDAEMASGFAALAEQVSFYSARRILSQ